MNRKNKKNDILLFFILALIFAFFLSLLNRGSINYDGVLEKDQLVIDSLKNTQLEIEKNRPRYKLKSKLKFRRERDLP